MSRLLLVVTLILAGLGVGTAAAVGPLSAPATPAFACTPDGHGGCYYNITMNCYWGHDTFTISSGLGEVTAAGAPSLAAGYQLSSDYHSTVPAATVSYTVNAWQNGVPVQWTYYEYGSGGYSC